MMKQIIIFEDEPDLRFVLESAFTAAGYAVRCAADGRWLRELCQACLPDLAITDIYMPNHDGVEIIRELRQNFPTVKVVAISGRTGDTDLRDVVERLGAHLTYLKPFHLENLVGSVQKLLR